MTSKFDILSRYFGYGEFREGQEPMIDALLAGRDALGIMPTGAGKSLCFQIPALMLDGISIIISPLISLMKDQVNALTQAGVAAAFLNSTLTVAQQRCVIENAENGAYKILYVAPERLGSQDFTEFAQSANIPFVGVDEAHCVSQWGQDFRPSYLRISEFIESLGVRPVIGGFTATATAKVSDDIVALLKLKDPLLVSTGFNRANLFFEVRNPRDKFRELSDFLRERADKSGIIYCLTRKSVEEVCERLTLAGYPATRYHAGLADAERKENQEAFQSDDARIMVPTNAFGMGIDKSNVAFVVHYNMPKKMEGYYQEAGRAGRDGTPADCLLLYSGSDVVTNQFLIEKSHDNDEMDDEAQAEFLQNERERLRVMTFYCFTEDCLRGYILKYFGEKAPYSCDNCANCREGVEKLDVTIPAQKILSCVKRMDERYGINMVIDTLRGSKNERILKLGLDTIKTYGIMADTKSQALRAIINFLITQDYLALTNDEYPILKLGQHAKKVLFDGETLEMKKPRERGERPERKRRAGAILPENEALFEKLRKLRAKFANAQSVPAFVIFTDASLHDMCAKMPRDENEFLEVSGVGNEKLKRYGKAFLDLISAE